MKFTPEMALGTKNVPCNNTGVSFIKTAIKKGYRHIATSPSYSNEKEIGKGITGSKVNREEIFITSYVYIEDVGNKNEFILDTIATSLTNLEVDYIDLLLIHSHNCDDVKDMWNFISDASDTMLEHKIMNIGVFNYDISKLQETLYGKIKPYANSIELTPFNFRNNLIKFCKIHSITVFAHGTLGEKSVLNHKILITLANKRFADPALILIRWNIQQGMVQVINSASLEHIETNLKYTEFCLSINDFVFLNKIENGILFKSQYADVHNLYYSY